MKMKAPKGASGCSFNGTEYECDKRGIVDVPDEAVAELVPHGFTPVGDKADGDAA
jgi:hypothetical protein